MRTLACLCLLAGLCLPPEALADDASDLPLAAVGWLGHGHTPDNQRANCSAVLIAADLVITADHCLTTGKSGTPADAGTLTFIAQLAGAHEAGRSVGSEIWLPPAAPAFVQAVGQLGLLRLAAPLSGDAAPPVLIGPVHLAAPGERVVVVGYPRTDQKRALVQDDCRIIRHAPPIMGLDCDVVSGLSGGAVLAGRKGDWLLVGIIVARAGSDGIVRSYAVMPQSALAQAAQAD